ncbi:MULTISPECIES: hypothetical protein [unclassified Butyrivibrio]|uniref:hypothetical protein n=1 Tax=unclassified Butyrivibrio TaxID=2639466 RepID=UPI0003F505D0|nr:MULTISPECIES: hypothetical protein [unclassified Butyrivibrio]SCY27632.1 hypothetical protein SAMN02910371_01651 [Butyrivibrio sp. INlla14]
MYVNRKEHFLSNSLFWAAGIHVLSNIALFLVRRFVPKANASQPDLANPAILVGQIAVAAAQVILMAIVFISAYDRLKKALSVVDEADRLKMAVLQKEAMGNKVPALTGNSILRLLELWGVILVAVRMVYDICSLVYRRFIADLIDFSSDSISNEDFIAIYNNTHGFKYIGILIALLLGSLMTGIFLNDKLIKVLTMILMAFFLLSFVLLEMQTITVGGYRIGIVWTSVIFHLIETLGLIVLGLYLRKKYIGL